MNRKGLIIRGIAILVITCLMLELTAYVLRRNTGYEKNQEFYSSDEEYDVLFFGSSHVTMGVLPMELWRNYGITSYNLANQGQTIPADYWLLKAALERKNPSLVVMDVYTLYDDQKYSVMEYVHSSFDPMPMSRTKVQAIRDLLPPESRMDFLMPFSIYHNRWESVTKEYFERELSVQKGAYENNEMGVPFVEPVPEIFDMGTVADAGVTETTNMEYMRKAIELCQEKGVPILLVAAPFNDETYLSEWTNGARQLAEEYNVPFVNGAAQGMLDTLTDLYDRGHMNSSGARKWTNYLGAYILENYDISDKRNDAAYQSWNEDYEAYREYKVQELNSVDDLNALLMLLYDKEWSACISVKAGCEKFGDDWFSALVSNAGSCAGVGEVNIPEDDTQNYFCLIDNKAGQVTEYIGSGEAAEFAASFGTLGYSLDGDGNTMLTLNGSTDATMLQTQIVQDDQNNEETEDAGQQNLIGVQVWVFNHDTGEVLRYSMF